MSMCIGCDTSKSAAGKRLCGGCDPCEECQKEEKADNCDECRMKYELIPQGRWKSPMSQSPTAKAVGL